MEVKPIILKFTDGREYTLEFNRATIDFAERRGFNSADMGSKAMMSMTELFFLAFRMHHPQMSKTQTDKILFDDLGGLSKEMAERLAALFAKPYDELTNETGTVKNPNLTVIL